MEWLMNLSAVSFAIELDECPTLARKREVLAKIHAIDLKKPV